MSQGKARDEKETGRGSWAPAAAARGACSAGRTAGQAESGRGGLERSPGRGRGGPMGDLTPLRENPQAPGGEHTAVPTRGELLTNT